MFDLEGRGKEIKLAKKGTSMILAGTVLIFIIDYSLWNLDFIADSLSDTSFETMTLLGSKLIGKTVGLLSIGLFYLLIFGMMNRKNFFEQTLQEYEAMSLVEKEEVAQKGKYLIVIPFALALLLLFYIMLFRLD
ncbi:hypothetical protein [Flavobacterium lindanitolerans]|uniref:hypothetical protein n=1 Tax=Flavobacterium lindanitolerans TaxID=428988 RepID=UPI002806E679|nr:hypothetical protein [Flavobacterium lindanitolerans]MDQ7961723.1 hypothetical protein [Flavobacterium lindanitolerans]